jgi:hypothetical protein
VLAPVLSHQPPATPPAAQEGGGGEGDAGEGGEGGEAAGLLCVANVHLFWDPAFPGIKLMQAKAVVTLIDTLEHTYGVCV